MNTSTPNDERAAARRSGPPAALIRVVAVLLLALVLGAAAFRLTGGRWLMVTSPSMGAAAPVGTLLLTRPVTAGQVRVGDIIAFHPALEPGKSFTHRVVEVDPGGGLRTRGDLNGATDPWTLRSTELTGRVVLRGWGLGWLVRALPLLIVGGGTLWLATRRRPRPWWQQPARLLGGSLLVAIAGILLRPFVAMSVVTTVTHRDAIELSVVSTGILPVRVRASGGHHLDLLAGHLGTLSARPQHPGAAAQLTVSPHMTLLWWLVVGLVGTVPLLLGLTVRPTEDPTAAPRRRRPARALRDTDLLSGAS